MRCTSTLLAAAAIGSTYAISLAGISEASSNILTKARDTLAISERAAASGGPSACPAVWTTVVAQLSATFLNATTGQCTDLARAAIRAAFHDCGTWDTTQGLTGGCDGSLITAQEAYIRPENDGLQAISDYYTTVFESFPALSFTYADLIQVGASVASKSSLT